MKDTTQKLRMILEPKVFKKTDERIRVEIKATKIQNIFNKNWFGTVPVLLRVYFRFDSTIAGRLVATGNSRYCTGLFHSNTRFLKGKIARCGTLRLDF